MPLNRPNIDSTRYRAAHSSVMFMLVNAKINDIGNGENADERVKSIAASMIKK